MASDPIAFLKKAQSDKEISDQVLRAVEKGNMVTAEAVLKIAREAGFSFDREEFEKAVTQSLHERFSAGERSLGDVVGANKPKDPPESSCAKGCLSYTKSWHPSEFARGG